MYDYRIIFLDIDGVVNSEIWARFCYNHYKRNRKHNNLLNPYQINRIAKYCENHNCRCIISSSWRWGNYSDTIIDFSKHWQFKKLIPYIIGITPSIESRHRGSEINYFLQAMNDDELFNKWNFSRYIKEKFHIIDWCIVDDDEDMLEDQLPKFVHTRFWTGITNKNFKQMNKIFNIK